MKRKSSNKGFTMVELVIAIAIISILAGAVAVALIKYIEKSRAAVDANNLETIKKQFIAYNVDAATNGDAEEFGYDDELIGKAAFVLTQYAKDGEEDFDWYKNDQGKDRWELLPRDNNKNSVEKYDILDENGNVVGKDNYKNGTYYWIKGDDGQMYYKKWPNEGTERLTSDQYKNLAGKVDADKLEMTYYDAEGNEKKVDVKDNYELWWKYQSNDYKKKHPLNNESTFADYLAYADPAFVIWYEDTACDYKWYNNINDKKTLEDYGIDPKAPTEEPEEETTEEPTTEAPKNEEPKNEIPTDETPSTPSTPSVPSTPSTTDKEGGAVVPDTDKTAYHVYIAVYNDHMEVYNDLNNTSASDSFVKYMGFNDNYSGSKLFGSNSAVSSDLKAKLGKSSYVLEAAFDGGEYNYTIYLGGKLAKYSDMFEAQGKVETLENLINLPILTSGSTM